jgi:flagellar hook-associated protein 3 FlgL
MRVTHTTIYDASQSRLANIVEDFNKANQEVSTGKRINRLSDDPVGISRVVGLRSNLSNLDQMTENIRTANTWLVEGETALRGIEGILGDTKILALAMNNGTISSEQRVSAAVQVQEMLGQLLGFANTQINGQYLFSGNKVDTKPYAFDDPAAPTTTIYSGNDKPFTLKTGKDTNMVVGYSGDDIFDSKTLTVDHTNNSIDFMDDGGGGLGAEITATIPPGDYTRDGLATVIGAAMTAASAAAPIPNNLTYTVTYDSVNKAYAINHDGADVRLLWNTGSNAAQSIAPDIGFNDVDVQGNALPSDNPVEWSLFKTLIDLKQYLNNDDLSGIERSMTRLDTQFGDMINEVSQIGYKAYSLDIKTNVIEDLGLSYNTQKSDIEEVDIIEAISRLQAKENAYQAALSSTSRVMKLSLVDYM